MLAPIPAPGPVFIHTEPCERYVEEGGYPTELTPYPVVLDGYGAGQRLIIERCAAADEQEDEILRIFEDASIQYVLVRDGEAGCYDFRVERTKEF